MKRLLKPLVVVLVALIWAGTAYAAFAQSSETADHAESAQPTSRPVCPGPVTRSLMAGDSWAQYMWDDGSHNDLLNKFGQGDKPMYSESLGADPGSGYLGTEFSISGSEARQWANIPGFTGYPWITNTVNALLANPDVDLVVLSIGGNDVLAAKSGGGWYKDMDLDAAGSEQALFDTIEANTFEIINALTAVRPDIKVMISSYDYVNFNIGWLTCGFYACPKREDLSRDPAGDLITDAELNGMMVIVEAQRSGWTLDNPDVIYGNGIGLMHYYYGNVDANGDQQDPPGSTPLPSSFPDFQPWPPGNPAWPSDRANFRAIPVVGDGDPIHLNYDGYQYKITHQIMDHFFPLYYQQPDTTFLSQGGANDGWTNGSTSGTDTIRVGDVGDVATAGIVSFDTSDLPDSATILTATLYILAEAINDETPYLNGDMGTAVVDINNGPFGAAGVENGDFSAPATATDAGCQYGTVNEADYALRVDFTAAGRGAVNLTGATELRIAFPNVDTTCTGWFCSAPDPHINFNDGDALLVDLPQRQALQTFTYEEMQEDGSTIEKTKSIMAIDQPHLGDMMGTSKPMLDISCISTPPATPVTTITAMTNDVSLDWPTVQDGTTGPIQYDLYRATTPYFTPDQNSLIGIVNDPTLTYLDNGRLGNPSTNYFYLLRARDLCQTESLLPPMQLGEFDFTIVPGS